MLIKFAVLLAAIGFSSAANPTTGSCLCVTANSVNVRDAAGLSSHVVTSVSHGQCFKFNGGILTKDGYKWYEVQDVNGHHRVWIASNFVSVSAASHCTHVSTHQGNFASGIVSHACLQCICQQESGCKPIGCHFDVNSDSCGYFQIKQGYWQDCGSPGGSWKSCADDLHCASQCVQNYMKRYASHYNCPMTCEGFAREHNGGPNGCHHSSTLSYWHGVQSHSGCHNVH
ncbi:lysozyme-like [Ruditapes philippinarum]|uniref:lysozyme-like n=1 Tax=Ruditapes philippinarum TaxID=129788 RepID=UPI00295AFD71|nr:lysozyme-like [Ruditapes philippinarum]